MRTELLVLSLLLAACRPEAPPAPPTQPDAPRVEQDDGLAASSDRAHGVVLPVGLSHAYDLDASKVYRSDHEPAQVLAFFTARHPDASVDAVGEGGVLRGLRVVESDGAPSRVEVSVLGRTAGGTRVALVRLPSSRPTDGAERARID